MSEPTFIGRVFVWGLDGTFAWSGVTTAQNEPTKLSYKDDVTRHDSKDKKGETIGVQFYNPNPKVTITAMPCKVMGAGAIAAAKTLVILPAKGAKVTLAGFPPNVASAEDTINSLLWLYLGGGDFEFTPEGEVQVTMTLEKFNTDIAQTPNS